MKKNLIITVLILVIALPVIAKEKEEGKKDTPKIKPIYTTLIEFLMETIEKPGVGYIIRFSDNEDAEDIPYLRFQAFELSQKVDVGVMISTENDFGPVCGFSYRGIRLDVGLSVKLHTLTRDLKNIKLSLIMGVSIPIKKR